MSIVDYVKRLLHSEKQDSQAPGSRSSAESFALHSLMHNNLILEMIRIQGLEITLEEMRKMRLPNLPASMDLIHMAAWKSLVDINEKFAKQQWEKHNAA